MRRILIITLILFFIGGALWFFFGRDNTKSSTTAQSGFKSFFPIGGGTTVPGNIVDQPISTGNPTTLPNSRFSQVSARAIAGYTTYSNIVRYVSRANGFVYEVVDEAGTLTPPLQISNIFIPNIYEAYFTDYNKTALLRFLRADDRTIATYSVPIPEPNPDNTRTQKEGTYLPDGIQSIATAPTSLQVARLTIENSLGVVTLTSSANKAPKEILRTPFREWLVAWPTQNNVYVQTKATATADGYLYTIDQPSKRLKKVLGDIAGLTTSVSPSGAYILYSQSVNGGFQTSLYSTKNGLAQALNLSILPEKCTWLKNEDLLCAGNSTVQSATYPDAWYAGLVRFQDQLYHIYTKSLAYDVLDTGSNQFDMVQLRTNTNETYLYFINKYTGVLWRFEL
jgi:hypothetical protein